MEYWRVEKVDSVIVLPVQNGRLFSVRPSFRAGIQRSTLNFPGGRLVAGQSPTYMAPLLLERELGLPAAAIRLITPLNNEPWMINSAFSNQGLSGFVGEIDSACTVPPQRIGHSALATSRGGVRNYSMPSIVCSAVRYCSNGIATLGEDNRAALAFRRS